LLTIKIADLKIRIKCDYDQEINIKDWRASILLKKSLDTCPDG